MLTNFLCGWYLYLAILTGLMSASAGPRTWLGRIGIAAAVVAVVSMPLQYWVPAVLVHSMGSLRIAGDLFLLAVGAVGIVAGRREDTKLIALIVVAVAALPVFLYYYQPPG